MERINPETGGICSLKQMMEWEFCLNCPIAGKCELIRELEEKEQEKEKDIEMKQNKKIKYVAE